MSSNYNGNAAASEAPAPPAGSNYNTTLVLPADSDGATWANVYQPFKTLADRAAFQQKSSNAFLPQTPGATSGYTVVSHTGGGGGTVTPSGSVQINGGYYFAIKIILGGAVGTATFQSSYDGGITYGGTQTTAASMTDATTNITLAFSGTFVATDVYQFTSAVTPQAQWRDALGAARSIVDHNGYRLGRITEIREAWTASAVSQPWQSSVGSGTLTLMTPTATYPSPFWAATPGVSTGLCILAGSSKWVNPASTMLAAVFEWEIATSAALTAGQLFYVGLSDSIAPSIATNYIWISATVGGNWVAATSGGATTDTGIAPGIGADPSFGHRIRLEVYGSSSPLGAVVRWYINEALVAAQTTGIPSVPLYVTMAPRNATGAGTVQTMQIGAFTATWNRYQSAGAL